MISRSETGRKRNREIRVIPRFVPMSEEDAEELANMIARLFVEDRRREMREQAKESRRDSGSRGDSGTRRGS